MALVHDDEVEEVGWKGPEQAGAPLVLGQRLVDPEVHLSALDHFARLDLVPRVAERREDPVLGLIDQDVAVGEVKNPGTTVFAGPVPASVPELPADLERDRGLSRTGRHRHEQAPPSGDDAFYHAVDRDLLVVALALPDAVVEGCEQLAALCVAEAGRRAIALPQVVGRREVRPGPFSPGQEIELDDLLAVGSVRELQPQRSGVLLRLLKPIGRRSVRRLGLDDRKGEIARVAQQVIDALRCLADESLAYRNDAAIGDRTLLGDRVRLAVPASRLELGDDELSTRVSFVHQTRPRVAERLPIKQRLVDA